MPSPKCLSFSSSTQHSGPPKRGLCILQIPSPTETLNLIPESFFLQPWCSGIKDPLPASLPSREQEPGSGLEGELLILGLGWGLVPAQPHPSSPSSSFSWDRSLGVWGGTGSLLEGMVELLV